MVARADHPSNTKRGGVCLFDKEHLPFVRRNDITCLDKCIVGEINVNNSKCFVTCVYRSPSQSLEETNNFLHGFEDLLLYCLGIPSLQIHNRRP